jgi:hypothetical protein
MGQETLLYKVVLLLHLSSVIVGFGSAFVYPFLAVRARALSSKESFAINHAVYGIVRPLSTYPIVAAAVFGLALVVISNKAIEFKETWISLAFLLVLLVLLVSFFLDLPNRKAMDDLEGRLASGQITPSKSGAEPKEAVELTERIGKVSAYSGVLHLLWLLLMIDMIWQPGHGV